MLFTAFDKLFVSSFNIEKLLECSYNDQDIYLHYFGHHSLAKTFRRFKYHNLALKIYGINAFTFYLYYLSLLHASIDHFFLLKK
jgi:hypothetical protein